MIESVEKKLRQIASGSRPADPDFEAMWAAIGERAAQAARPTGSRRKAPLRKRWVAAVCVALCMALAVPVFAEPSATLGWSWNLLTQRAVKSLAAGDGTRIDQTVESGGISFHLIGAVSDDLRTDLLFDLSGQGFSADDTAAFGQIEWLDDRGVRYDGVASFSHREDGRLQGLLEMNSPMPVGERKYTLKVRDLVLYRDALDSVALNPSGANEQQAVIGKGGVASATIESIQREGDAYTVRYRFTGSDSSMNVANNPRLVLRANGVALRTTNSTVLPPPSSNTMLRQDTYELSDAQLAKAEFAFARLEESGRRSGEWSFFFEADGRKAEEAIYRSKLDADSTGNDAGLQFTELDVTPLEIRLAYDRPKVSFAFPIRQYEKATLLLNGMEIEGSRWETDIEHNYFRFLSPEWYRDWSGVPMQLRLSSMVTDAKASSDQLLTLADPTSAKQTIDADVGGFPVRFTYYKDGADLIVESEWLSETNGGIVQTYIMANGKRIFAELNPEPPGGNGTHRKIERYRNLPAGTLQLNPFLYRWTDESKSETISIQ